MLKNSLKPFIKDNINKSFSPLLSKITKFRNLYSGEKCYLIGDGISLKWFNLKYFADYQSITVGVLPYHRDFSILNYKHALLIDPFAFYPIRRYPPNSNYIISNGSQGSYRQVIKKHSKTNFFIHLFNYPLIRNNNITHIFNTIPDKKLPSDFISNRYKCFEGSFAASITLAIYMGFRKIYLIGFDYTHFPTRSHHWYEKGRGIINQNKHFSFFSISYNFFNSWWNFFHSNYKYCLNISPLNQTQR